MRSSLLNTLLPCCFSNPYTSADAYLQPLTTVRPGGGGGLGGGISSSGGVSGGNRPPPSLEELLDASAAAREATWRSLGALEPLALSQHPAGPAAGGPKVREGFGGGVVVQATLRRRCPFFFRTLSSCRPSNEDLFFSIPRGRGSHTSELAH